ncbi:hypothetical protein THIOKS1990009 [Thiocapsa sp. KS1]|nr:hypothetical protein THIOKS1990009 [Thiocapsa sp. KS1]
MGLGCDAGSLGDGFPLVLGDGVDNGFPAPIEGSADLDRLGEDAGAAPTEEGHLRSADVLRNVGRGHQRFGVGLRPKVRGDRVFDDATKLG